MSSKELKAVESGIGPLLQRLGYPLSTDETPQSCFEERVAQAIYPRYFEVKHWLKMHTVLGRMASVKRLHLA
jgi:hypothetical protein